MKKIAIIGAGPGGLAAGMVLSKKGYDIHIYEKDQRVGGRSQRITIGDYQFDLGPTFLMYIDILRDVFKFAGYELEKELEVIRLDHLYTLMFNDVTFNMSKDPIDNANMYERYSKGMGESYLNWLNAQETKLNAIESILKRPFPNVSNYLRKDVLKAIPELRPAQSVYSHLSKFNHNSNFINSLSFQSKYLGMSSFDAPSVFTILPYLEHALGLYHVKGGLNQINEKMAELIERNGGTIHLSAPVEKIVVENKNAKGLVVKGQFFPFDEVIVNADFSYAMTNLIEEKHLRKHKPHKLEKMKYSISTFMIYLGLDKKFDFAHHEIIFSKNYEAYLNGLAKGEYSDDLSIYLHNPSLMDDSYAPKNHSSLYLLVPVPNLRTPKDWERDKDQLYNQAIDLVERKHGINIRSHITTSKVITPQDWESTYNVKYGAVFNLAHNLGQMLAFRPQNKYKDINHLYLVGGGTHPGSGLPTIYQSAIILNEYL